MKKIAFLLSIVCLSSSLLAQANFGPNQIQAAKEIRASDLEITPRFVTHALVPQYLHNVNVVTGEYVEKEEDLVVDGSEPISFRRFYRHLSPPDLRYGSWSINPETALIANFEWKELPIFASVGEKEGAVVQLDSYKVMPLPKHLSSAYGREEALCFTLNDTRTHPKNFSLAVWKSSPDKEKFAWQGFIQDGSGGLREFSSPSFEWHKRKSIKLDPADWRGDLSPDFWIPYATTIQKEILPNGNIIQYEYEKWREDKYFPNPRLLSSIKVYNQSGTTLLGKMDFRYEKYKWKYEEELSQTRQGAPVKYKDSIEEVLSFRVVGSDGRSATYLNTQRNKAEAPISLLEASTPQEEIKYRYQKEFLTETDRGNGRIFKTEYDPKTNKVVAQYAPVGQGGEMVPVAKFVYRDQVTAVYDGENNPTVYHFDDYKRITSIEKYLNNALYSVLRNIWDEKGHLEAITIADANFQVFKQTAFKYDSRGNVLEAAKSGLGGENESISYTYSKEEEPLNLKTSEKDGKKEIRYTYKPKTDLLASEIVYDGKNIKKRTFYTYDDCAICTKIVVDDGKTAEEKDIKGVNYRKITYIKPRREFPCFGLPATVEEKTIDSRGNEILLKKVVYSYHPSGQIEKEDHYDAKNIFRYSLLNEYDEKERLKKRVDALGNETTFEYDKNNNKIAEVGPRVEKKWEYDKANLPILEKIGPVTSRKVYDRLGRVVEAIGPLQNSTKYTYDALGRITQIVRPDGAKERKEYDLLGNVVKEIDANGFSTGKGYNYRGQPLHAFYADGSSEHFIYNPTGTLKEFCDKNGAKTVYTYDIFDNPVKTEIFANGKLLKTTSATYSPFSKLSETDAVGITTTYAYDFVGRKISEKRGDRETKYFYDALGRLSRTQRGEVTFTHEYDLLDRVIEKRVEDSFGNVSFKENYAYDEDGNKTAILTCMGTVSTTYNAQNLPVSITSPDGHTTDISYSYNKVLIKSTLDPEGIQTSETYDCCNRLSEILVKNSKNEVLQHREFIYDLVGNRIQAFEHIYEGPTFICTIVNRWEYGPLGRIEKRILSDQKETTYLYDTIGRLKTIVKPDGVELSYSYDDLGRLSRFSSSKKDINYAYSYDRNDLLTGLNGISRSYDIHGNLTKEKLENGYVLKSSYDPFGRRKTLTLPDGTKVNYSYKANALFEVKYNNLTYTYKQRNLSSKPTEIILPNDLGSLQFTYDECFRTKQIDSPHGSSQYAYNSKGLLITCGDMHYAYDELSQLISEQNTTFAYDSLFNRLSKNGLSCKINDFCQIVHDGCRGYRYDENGNLIQAGENSFFYDSLDRLIKVQSDKTYEYVYDGLNRRMTKSSSSKSIHFMWDGAKEIGSSNSELKILGEGNICFIEINKKIYVPLQDYRKSVIALVDIASSNPAETYRYSAFGEELGSPYLTPWRFLSNRIDDETGFVYFGERFYMPALGRWLTPNLDHEPNPYVYLNNSPLVIPRNCGRGA